VSKNSFARAVSAALLGAVLSASAFAVPALADIKDYQFQLVQQEAKVGEAIVAVRLVGKRTGRPVGGWASTCRSRWRSGSSRSPASPRRPA
jgi:hypothetical protein